MRAPPARVAAPDGALGLLRVPEGERPIKENSERALRLQLGGGGVWLHPATAGRGWLGPGVFLGSSRPQGGSGCSLPPQRAGSGFCPLPETTGAGRRPGSSPSPRRVGLGGPGHPQAVGGGRVPAPPGPGSARCQAGGGGGARGSPEPGADPISRGQLFARHIWQRAAPRPPPGRPALPSRNAGRAARIWSAFLGAAGAPAGAPSGAWPGCGWAPPRGLPGPSLPCCRRRSRAGLRPGHGTGKSPGTRLSPARPEASGTSRAPLS